MTANIFKNIDFSLQGFSSHPSLTKNKSQESEKYAE